MKTYRFAAQLTIFAIVLGLFFAVIRGFIIPVIMGLFIALVFRPIYKRLLFAFGKRSHLAALTSTILVTCCVLLPLILIGVFVVKDAASLVKTLSQVVEKSENPTAAVMTIPALSNVYNAINKVRPLSQEEFAAQARSAVAGLNASAGKALRTIAAAIPKKIVGLLFFLVSFYFGLIDGPRFVKFLREDLPFSNTEIDELFDKVQKICRAVILGAFIAGIVQGTIIGLSYWILGIPRPALFGVLTATFSFVPLVGAAPTGIGGTLYLLTNGKLVHALFMLIALLIASLSDNVVKPWVLKGKTELHPLLGLLSVIGGLQVFGFPGLFLGPVVTALSILFIHLMRRRIKERTELEQVRASSAK